MASHAMEHTTSQSAADTVVNAADLTIDGQASLTSGSDSWHLQDIPSRGIPAYMITDGPYGLRKMLPSKMMDLAHSVPATCFPPAVGMASSWNPGLARRTGEAMAEECIEEQVAVILGPAINIKRNPLGGRCFEYWSEDPYLAGHQAAGMVEGIQSRGIGTSLKHFAANNQETDRMRVDVIVSERALREIYLPAFEYVVKTAQPWTVMCSYNRINGVYSSQNSWLLTDVLRHEWGFNGIVMSDWGADHDRVAALNAGLNLEMPPSGTDNQIADAARDGRISREHLETMAQGMLDLVNKCRPAMSRHGYHYDRGVHDELARTAARESIVMLKNDHRLLPLADTDRVAVIGEFARTPRYEGGGSSQITPTHLTSFLEAVAARGANTVFAPGYTLTKEGDSPTLVEEAVEAARDASSVLMFMGLPEYAESEGFDRATLDLPAKQIAVLDAVRAVNPRVIVVLSNGSVVNMEPWRNHVPAILEGWLLGQAGGAALADIVYGDVSPSGKLAQSIPLNIDDDPTSMNWPGGEHRVDYGEGVFVGYRYYDTFHRPVAYPFGFGMSYADFTIDDVHAYVTDRCSAIVDATVTNTSDVAAAETVQLYVAPPDCPVQRPSHELRAFEKVQLDPHESRTIRFTLDSRAFAYWSETLHDWHVVGGHYGIEIGTSSRDIAQTATIELIGDDLHEPISEWSTFTEWHEDPVGRQVLEQAARLAKEGRVMPLPDIHGTDASSIFLRSLPVGALSMLGGQAGQQLADYLLDEYRKAVKKSS